MALPAGVTVMLVQAEVPSSKQEAGFILDMR